MLQKVIIDGYNMIHAISIYKEKLQLDLESARETLIHDLQIYKSLKKIDLLIVFDGSAEVPGVPGQYKRGGVNVMFSHAPLKADPVIMKMVQTEKQKRRIVIVSNDNEIINFSRSYGCEILSPQLFYERIKTSSKDIEMNNKYNNEMSPDELEEWKKIFGVDD